MKYLVKIFVVTFFIIICTQVSAEQKVAFIDMKYILNNSKAGKDAQDYLKKTFEQNQKKYLDQEKALKKDENDLLSKKSELSKEEYTLKANELRKRVMDHQAKRRASLDKIAKQRLDARELLLKKLDPILKQYVDDNQINLVIDKTSVYAWNGDLDVTKAIIEKLDKEVTSLNLK